MNATAYILCHTLEKCYVILLPKHKVILLLQLLFNSPSQVRQYQVPDLDFKKNPAKPIDAKMIASARTTVEVK